ncbi:MAG: hypothetical protein ABI813_00870 [Bacteroidota bacterium]
MKETSMEGKISFVHHDKHYVTIEYTHNNKQKSINGNADEASQQLLKEQKQIKKIHHFHEGDEVYFTIERSARGDKMVAANIRYRFNNNLGNLVNRARTNNIFTGYLKQVGDNYFVKETGSHLFFPLLLSPWELPPSANQINEPLQFQLHNTEKPEKITAMLLHRRFIPQFLAAQKHVKNKTAINATVYKITPHGIYVNVIGDKLQAKIPVKNEMPDIQEGDRIKVIVTYLSDKKMVVEMEQRTDKQSS